jgi:hypothetical protein
MQFPAPDVKAILRHKAYLVTTAGIFLITLGAYFPLFYLQGERGADTRRRRC